MRRRPLARASTAWFSGGNGALPWLFARRLSAIAITASNLVLEFRRRSVSLCAVRTAILPMNAGTKQEQQRETGSWHIPSRLSASLAPHIRGLYGGEVSAEASALPEVYQIGRLLLAGAVAAARARALAGRVGFLFTSSRLVYQVSGKRRGARLDLYCRVSFSLLTKAGVSTTPGQSAEQKPSGMCSASQRTCSYARSLSTVRLSIRI